jgi:hypothetical protein
MIPSPFAAVDVHNWRLLELQGNMAVKFTRFKQTFQIYFTATDLIKTHIR